MKRFYLCLAVAIIFCCVGIVYAKTPVVQYQTLDTTELSEEDESPIKINPGHSVKCDKKKAYTGEKTVISFTVKGKSREEIIAKIEKRLKGLGLSQEEIARIISEDSLYFFAPILNPKLGSLEEFQENLRNAIRELPNYVKKELTKKEKLLEFVDNYARKLIAEKTSVEGESIGDGEQAAVSDDGIIVQSARDYCRQYPWLCQDNIFRRCGGCNSDDVGHCVTIFGTIACLFFDSGIDTDLNWDPLAFEITNWEITFGLEWNW